MPTTKTTEGTERGEWLEVGSRAQVSPVYADFLQMTWERDYICERTWVYLIVTLNLENHKSHRT